MAEITNFRGEASVAEQADPLDAAVDAVIARVGERVRRAREMKGLPRRTVSEVSGVSPRYLAQLEAGEGNISIGLLQRVAAALDHRIEWFLGEDDPWTSEAARVADLYRSAPASVREKVLQALAPEASGSQRRGRICLIGLRGAGKSTLGAMAGRALDVPFLELNREIEDHSGMPINEIMELYGQEGYRQLEAQAVDRVIEAYDTVILAAAGGIVAAPDTYAALLGHFHTVWIQTSPEEHMSRVRSQGDTRPMAGYPEAMNQLRTILASREPLYERALAHLDTSGRPLEASVEDLASLIRDRGFLETA